MILRFLSRWFIIAVLSLAAVDAFTAEAKTTSQIVVVTTPAWDSDEGQLDAFEMVEGRWTRSFARIPVTVGRNGLGWGLGMHPPDLEGPQKKEGDKRAPAGIFRLESSFGTQALKTRGFVYRITEDTDFWVDDSRSAHYNRFVSTRTRNLKRDWSSAETLRRKDGLYDYVIVVGHNRDPITAGRGSAIFMHAWSAPGRPTIGCTAMEKATVKQLILWLDSDKVPLLIQAPRQELRKLPMPDAVRTMVVSGEK